MTIEHQLRIIDHKLSHLHVLAHEILERQAMSATGIDPQALEASKERLRASAEALQRAVSSVTQQQP